MSHDGRIRFSYWSDPLCVWAFVAQPRLQRILDQFGGLLDIEYRVVPVFGSLEWRFSQGPWADEGAEGRARKTREICVCHGFEDVTGAVWLDDMPASSWSPGMAIKAVCVMEERESAAKGACAAYQARLRRAFFVDNINVARRRAQLETAEACGLDVGAVEHLLNDGTGLARLWEDHHLQQRSFVRGSPTYVFDGGREILYGNVAEGIVAATIDELRKGPVAGRSEC